MRKMLVRKRPCRICRCWFTPHPRLKDRQKTCGTSHCKREWHRKMCRKWNRENADYFKANYLQKKLETATGRDRSSKNLPPQSLFKTGLPQRYVQEVISIQHLVRCKRWLYCSEIFLSFSIAPQQQCWGYFLFVLYHHCSRIFYN